MHIFDISNVTYFTKNAIINLIESIPVENKVLKSAAFFFLIISACGLLFSFFKMPAILGYMVTGILLGPVLQYIADSHVIEQFKEGGDFGLIILMFITGLELDINKFIKNGAMKPISFVGYQFLYTVFVVLFVLMLPKTFILNLINHPIRASVLAIILSILTYSYMGRVLQSININGITWKLPIFLCILLLFNIKNSLFINLDLKDAELIILIIALLTFNSTAISIKLLENRDQKETHVGTNVIGVLIAQDLAFVIVLIVLKSFGESINLISIILKITFALLVLYLVNLLSKSKPSFLSYFLDYVRKASIELHVITITAFCLICASLSDALGLSDIYGAFIAGLLLGNIYKHRHQILILYQPISAILIAIFFAYIGILVNLDVLMQHFSLIIFINTIIFIVKYFINYRTNLITNENNDEFSESCICLSSLTLTQMSEFSILMISIVFENILSNVSSAGAEVTRIGLSLPNLKLFFSILESSCLVSLTLGCLVTVILKRILYRSEKNKTIKKEAP